MCSRATPTPRAIAIFARAAAWTIAFAAGCGAQRNDYAAAGIGLGAAVTASAVNRMVTGGCWARCGRGMICDRRSGLCVEGECAPGCPVGNQCVREPNGHSHCADEALTMSVGRPAVTDAGVPVTPSATDAGAFIARSSPSTESEADNGAEGGVDAGSATEPPAPDGAADWASESPTDGEAQ